MIVNSKGRPSHLRLNSKPKKNSRFLAPSIFALNADIDLAMRNEPDRFIQAKVLQGYKVALKRCLRGEIIDPQDEVALLNYFADKMARARLLLYTPLHDGLMQVSYLRRVASLVPTYRILLRRLLPPFFDSTLCQCAENIVNDRTSIDGEKVLDTISDPEYKCPVTKVRSLVTFDIAHSNTMARRAMKVVLDFVEATKIVLARSDDNPPIIVQEIVARLLVAHDLQMAASMGREVRGLRLNMGIAGRY